MRFSWFLALRYLKPKRTFISIITLISIAGVTLGVAVLMVVIAVMSGFEKRIKEEWLKVEPPLLLVDDTREWLPDTSAEEPGGVPIWRELLPRVKSFPGVGAGSPYIYVNTLIQQAKPKSLTELNVPEPPPPPPPAPPEDGAKGAAGAAAQGVVEAPTPRAQAEHGTPAEPDPPPGDAKALPAPATESTAAAEPASASGVIPDEPVATKPGEQPITGLDRTRPIAPAIIYGVDLEDSQEMDRLEKRFAELKAATSERRVKVRDENGGERIVRQKIPRARGEFDLSGETIVLSTDLAARIERGADVDPVTEGETRCNIFGPSLINKVIDKNEQDRKAADDPALKEKFEKQDEVYPTPEELTITGTFSDDKQPSRGYVSLHIAQRMAGAGRAVDGIAVELDDPYLAEEMARKIEGAGLLPDGWRTETWMQRHRQQFEAVAFERAMMFVVLGCIVVVAAFCIMNTMITMAVMKRREIGMMRALGAKVSHILGLFMTKGAIVGAIGVGFGYGLGMLVLHYRNTIRDWINDHFGRQIFDPEVYGLRDLPSDLRVLDIVIICCGALVLCVIAALPPVFMVGRMDPAKALRSDR